MARPSLSARGNIPDEDKATALAALDANDGNVKRTATQLGIPHKTLDDWAKGRNQNPAVVELHTIKKGSLADKFENLAHLIVDAMPSKIAKATLSQCVSSGIATDKAIRLRSEEADMGTGVELARLLDISVEQLPPTLKLESGEKMPEGLEFIFDTRREPSAAYEVENPSRVEMFRQQKTIRSYWPHPTRETNRRFTQLGALERTNSSPNHEQLCLVVEQKQAAWNEVTVLESLLSVITLKSQTRALTKICGGTSGL